MRAETIYARTIRIMACCVVLIGVPNKTFAYAALTHEAIVDSAWDDAIVPLLRRRFAGISDAELREAHAYVYGGSIIQDLGYYPFGSEFFTYLVHYVRSGDFAVNLLQEAEPFEEYAFALGALEHFLADEIGHPMGINPAVAVAYPRLRKRYGATPTWADDPAAHIKVEFGFDVLQVARGRYSPAAHHDFIGFKVATPLLERVFFKTYGLELRRVIPDLDLAIATYRHGVSEVIPLATEIAWELKKDDLERSDPPIRRDQFVYTLSRGAYEKEWGNRYERPSWFATLMSWLLWPIPKIGPFDRLDIKPPTPETERLFVTSFNETVSAYRAVLSKLLHGPVNLPNTNLDTGLSTRAGDYSPADETYAALLDELSDRYFATVTPNLRANIVTFYGAPLVSRPTRDPQWRKLLTNLAFLREGASGSTQTASVNARLGRRQP